MLLQVKLQAHTVKTTSLSKRNDRPIQLKLQACTIKTTGCAIKTTGPYNYSPVQLKLQARAIESTDIQIKLQAHAIETTGLYNWNYRPVQQKLQAHATETTGPCNWDYRHVQLKLQAMQLNYRPMQLKLEAHATETSRPCKWDYRPMKLKLQTCTTETTGLYNWNYPYSRPVQANHFAVLVMHQTQMWTLHTKGYSSRLKLSMRYRGTEARLTNVSTSRRRPNTSSVLGASWGSCCTNRAGKLRSATCHKPALYSLKTPSFCLRHVHFSHNDIQKKTA